MGLKGDPADSPEIFKEDIIRGGGGLSDPRLVDRFVHDIPDRMEEMLAWGARVRNLTHNAGHRYPRSVIINGRDYADTLLRQIRKRNHITTMEHVVALDLYLEDGTVQGVYALDIKTGRYLSISAKKVVLATGGAAHLFPVATPPNDLLGDGIAMALRAGADLRDMEFQTFMLACAAPGSVAGNTYPYILVCRCSAQMFNREAERFMYKTDPENMEKSTRDKVAIASAKEILEGRGGPNGGIYVSVRHVPRNLFEYYKEWYESGLGLNRFDPKDYLPDLSQDAIEAVPAAHFWCGGITIDEECRTTVPGLYAAGECTGGMHGANRLSGNAMAEILVMGAAAGNAAAAASAGMTQPSLPDAAYYNRCEAFFDTDRTGDPVTLKKLIQKLAWESVGPIRDGMRMKDALAEISGYRAKIKEVGLTCKERTYNLEWLDALSQENLCDCYSALVCAAMERTENLGSHYRLDAEESSKRPYVVHVRKQGNACEASRVEVEAIDEY